jgi:hypothetical protein
MIVNSAKYPYEQYRDLHHYMYNKTLVHELEHVRQSEVYPVRTANETRSAYEQFKYEMQARSANMAYDLGLYHENKVCPDAYGVYDIDLESESIRLKHMWPGQHFNPTPSMLAALQEEGVFNFDGYGWFSSLVNAVKEREGLSKVKEV